MSERSTMKRGERKKLNSGTGIRTRDRSEPAPKVYPPDPAFALVLQRWNEAVFRETSCA